MSDSSDNFSYIDPSDAWAMMQADPGVTLIDVRSDMEYLMIGHPKAAVNVAWIDAPDWTVSENFVVSVRKALLGRISRPNQTAPALLLLCRSGNRSQDAAEVLAKEGLTDIYVINGGFEGPLDSEHHRNTIAGWRYEGLPWEQC